MGNGGTRISLSHTHCVTVCVCVSRASSPCCRVSACCPPRVFVPGERGMEASSSPPVDPGTPVADEALARLMGGGVRAARKKRRAKHIEKLRQAAANVKSPTFVYADDDPQPPDTMWLCPRLHARLSTRRPPGRSL